MSRTLNKVMIIGNVGKEPELKHTPSGIPVTSFRLATSDTWRDREGKQHEHTDWHTVVAWRGLAEVVAKIVTRGSRVFIEGKLQTRSLDTNGVKKQIVEILADNILMLENKRKAKEDDESESESDYSEDSYTYEGYDSEFGDGYQKNHNNFNPF